MNPDLLSPTTIRKRRRRRWHRYPIVNQLNQMREWLVKRAKSPGTKSSPSIRGSPNEKGRMSSATASQVADGGPQSTIRLAVHDVAKPVTLPVRRPSTSSRRRSSLSPAPHTPHQSLRRPSVGLRGRKSTSSSVSSVRSIRHRHSHSHSKASSASLNSLTPSITTTTTTTARSPRTSIKVLPATPTTATFPSNIRLVRASPSHYNETARFGLPSPGLPSSKRKRRPPKGPLLSISTSSGSSSRRDSSTTRSAGRRSGEIIEEEDEDDVEEVEAFSPVMGPADVELTGTTTRTTTKEDTSPCRPVIIEPDATRSWSLTDLKDDELSLSMTDGHP